MITFVSNVRPFEGQFDVIQRTAIASWTALPDAQAIITGDVKGAAEFARELGIEHVPGVATNEQRQELVRDIWRIGMERARHNWVCVLNADNVVGEDMVDALEAIWAIEKPFVVGQRRDMEMGEPDTVTLHRPGGIDWFLMRKGTIPLDDIPDYAVGRACYDNWLVWVAMEKWNMTVINATKDIVVYHLNHGNRHGGSKRNREIFGQDEEARKMGRIDKAPWVLEDDIVRRRDG